MTPPLRQDGARLGRPLLPALKHILIGRPLSSEDEQHQRLSKKIALPVFAGDAISSTAYATDEILVVVVLQAGLGLTASARSCRSPSWCAC